MLSIYKIQIITLIQEDRMILVPQLPFPPLPVLTLLAHTYK
jgi:hypothetical protein